MKLYYDKNLINILNKIDGKGYKAYKEIEGIYKFDKYKLAIDHVQGDPFATPSRIRVIVNQKDAKIPNNLYDNYYKRIAVIDFLTRVFKKNLDLYYKKTKGSGKSGNLTIDCGGQEMLDRTSVIIDDEKIEVRLELGLPAFGRKILGREAIKIFDKLLPNIVLRSVFWDNIDSHSLETQVKLSEDQNYIRQQLVKRGYVAFIANGSVLPRESGISDKPKRTNAVPFKSPETMKISFDLPNSGKISGMGIKKGVTLIVGGGYHGKSTLLNALQLGVYNHISGDGREYVITVDDAVKIRSEDGRNIEKVDISMFINHLPNHINTKSFSTQNASGSTSQSANIIEAIQAGTKLLLIDEDTSATNFMIRDARMQMLVPQKKEPITPFIDRVNKLYEDYQVSSIIVIGGSGDYFDVADNVIMIDEYKLNDVTHNAKSIAKQIDNKREVSKVNDIKTISQRYLSSDTFSKDSFKTKIKANGTKLIMYNRSEINLLCVEQLIDSSQTRSIAMIIQYIKNNHLYDKSINEIVNFIDKSIKTKGLGSISNLKGHPGNLALPRKMEIASALNRFRNLVVKQTRT